MTERKNVPLQKYENKRVIWAEIVIVTSAGLNFLQSEGGERKEKRIFLKRYTLYQ